jgi:hypothetical protein
MKIEAATRPKAPRPFHEIRHKTMTQLVEDIPLRTIEGEVIPVAPRPTKYPEPPRDYHESVDRLRDKGLDEVLSLVEEGHSMRELCLRIGTRPAHLNRWIASTEGADARMREARRNAAQAWLDRGLAAVANAVTPMGLAKGREIAHMCRKYAAICDPSYSDRVQVDTTVKAADPQSIDAQLRLIQAEVAKTQVNDEAKPQ